MVFQPHCRTFLIDKETFKGFLIKIRRLHDLFWREVYPLVRKWLCDPQGAGIF